MKRLTAKQRKFVEGVVAGKSGTQAALDAYETTDYGTAAVIAAENINKPNIQAALEKALVAHNITLERALLPISKGLDAMKTNEYTGEVTEDLKTQLQASDRALKLLGYSGNADVSGNTFLTTINNYREKYTQ